MVTRLLKLSLVASLALFHLLVVIDNVIDFQTNFEFVRHVLSMDSTFPGTHAHARAITSPAFHVPLYVAIIVWEAMAGVLLAWGCVNLLRKRLAQPPDFHSAKRVAIIGMTCSLLLWLVGFIDIGGEWFMMWQSQTWNGQQEAFRMFVVVALVLLVVLQPELEVQP